MVCGIAPSAHSWAEAAFCQDRSVAQTRNSGAAEEQVPHVDPMAAPDGRRSGVSIWLWPAVAITAVAGAEHLRGIPGGVAALGFCLAVACLLAGRVLDARERGYAVVLAVALSGAAVLVLLRGVPGQMLRGSAPDRAGPVDLRGRRLDSAMVDHLDLRGSLLAGAQLGGLDLRKKSLAGAIAPGVGLARARLDGISVRGADLRGADLRGACLRGTDLTGAILAGARVDGAELGGAILDRGDTSTWLGRPASPEHGCR